MLIIQMFLGIFSFIGIYECLRKVFDRYVIKRSQATCKILICGVGTDAEYTLRFLESRFAFGEYSCLFDGITVLDKDEACKDIICKLNEEYKNIT